MKNAKCDEKCKFVEKIVYFHLRLYNRSSIRLINLVTSVIDFHWFDSVVARRTKMRNKSHPIQSATIFNPIDFFSFYVVERTVSNSYTQQNGLKFNKAWRRAIFRDRMSIWSQNKRFFSNPFHQYSPTQIV